MALNHLSNDNPPQDWPKLRKHIEFYEREGLCYLPAHWGRKNPALDSWEEFENRLPTMAEKADWFHEGKPTGIGVVCGGVSRGLVILAFNDQDGAREFFGEERWQKLLSATFVTKSVRGYHVWLRSDTLIKSQKVGKDKNESWLEIRSDGDFTMAPPSMHPDGVLYQAIGVDRIYKPDDLAGFITRRLVELGLRPKKLEEEPRAKEKPRSDEFNAQAVEKLSENCAFMRHCQDDAVILSEPHWWSECDILSFLGEPGREKAHELSQPYPKYTEVETDKKLEYAKEAVDKNVGPHTCKFIEQNLGFSCPEDCLAKKWGLKSPVVLATSLAKQGRWGLRYLLVNDKGKVTGVNTKALVDDLLAEFTFKTIFGIVRDDILVYANGVYIHNGEKVIREECEARVGAPMVTTHTIHEIRDRIGGQTFTDRERFNTEKYIINVENGLLNVNTRELTPHTPDFLSTIRIPITYDPGAKCSQIERFLKGVLPGGHVNTLLEFFGYALIPDYSIPVVLILLGLGGNGKSQVYKLLRRFIGQVNCCSINIRNIKDYPFTLATLEGKLLNIQGDLSGGWFQDLNTLKMLTGEDPISAPRKYKDTIDFDNFARLTFASNKPPKIEEDTLAVWRRILMLSCPNEFRPGDTNFVKDIAGKISTPAELSGLLNLALDGLQRVFANNDFTYEGTYEDRGRRYTMASDPVRVFVDEYCDTGPSFKVLKSRLYKAYLKYCDKNRSQLIGEAQLGKELRQVPGLSLSDKQYQEGGERVRWWLGIQLRPELEPGIDMEV